MRGALLKVGVVLALGLLGPSVAAAQDPDLAGEWHVDSIAGGTTADTSGHGYTGHVLGSPTAVADGRFAGALHFPTKGSAIDAGNFAGLQPANVSVLAWVRASGVPAHVKDIIAQGAESTCNYASYALYMGGGTQTAGLRFYVATGASPASAHTYATPPAPNTMWDGHWHAVLGTYDGTTVRLYVDGTEVGSIPASGPITYGLDTSNELWIGDFAGGAQCSEQTQFSGDIDEVRVWDRGLTAAEASYVSSSTATTPPELPIPGPPPPPPPNPPQNIVVPGISQSATPGTYTCSPGQWKNVPASGYSYRWIANENGQGVPVGQGSSFTPTNAIYGYPITCEVTVQGPTAPISASSNPVFFTSAGLSTMPKAYGDIRVKGIDVWQVVQPNAGAQAYGYPSGTYTTYCGGGTPTAFAPIPGTFFCGAGSNPQDAMQHTDYTGVKLDSDKRTTVSVYINTVVAPPGDPNLPINVELSGTSNGQSLGDPLVKPVPTPSASNFSVVMATERNLLSDQVQFLLPSSWTAAGHLTLTAHIDFPKSDFGPTYGAYQCPDPNSPPGDTYQINQYPRPNCDTDDTYTLNNIPFETFTGPIFQPVDLLTSGQTGFAQTPTKIMAAATKLYPGGSRFVYRDLSPYSIDIDAASQLTTDSKGNCVDPAGNKVGGNYTGGQAARACREQAIDVLMAQWVAENPARLDFCGIGCVRLRMYDGVLGISNFDSGAAGNMLGCPATGFCPEPGYQHPVGNDISKVTNLGPSPSGTGWLIVNTLVHPVQGAAHELGHWLTLPHAGSNTGPCNSQPSYETWPGGDDGRLQGVRFNPRGPNGWRAAPQVDGTPSEYKLYDLMSYCADFKDRGIKNNQVRTLSPTQYPGNAWLSARNWNHVVSVLESLGNRISTAGGVKLAGDIATATAKRNRFWFAVGVAGPSGGVITRVVPADGQDGVPASIPSSPYRVRSLGVGGKVLLDAGIALQFPQDIRSTISTGTYTGPVAPNASAVELVHNGVVLAREDRSRPPHVKLIVPHRGFHVRRGQSLSLHWRGSDPDTKALQVTIDVSADGKTWHSAYTGPNRGHFKLPSAVLGGSSKFRVRVILNDGFSSATSTSPKFRTPGAAPQAQIIAPLAGDMVLGGQRTRLVATAISDLGQRLTGRSLTWFAGRKRLGRGATLSTRLPAGKVTLRLVARGANGLTRTITEHITVTAPKLRVVRLSVPQRVKKGTKTVTITLRTSATSKLTVGRKHYTVRTRPTRITLSLPAKPAVGLVKVPFTLSPTSRSVSGKIRGSIWVVRT